MNFKNRIETKYLYVVKKDLKGTKRDTLVRQAIQKGEFDTGYHFILSNTGLLEADRQSTAVAGWDFENNLESLYVLADSTGNLTDAQRNAIKQLNIDNLKVIEV